MVGKFSHKWFAICAAQIPKVRMQFLFSCRYLENCTLHFASNCSFLHFSVFIFFIVCSTSTRVPEWAGSRKVLVLQTHGLRTTGRFASHLRSLQRWRCLRQKTMTGGASYIICLLCVRCGQDCFHNTNYQGSHIISLYWIGLSRYAYPGIPVLGILPGFSGLVSPR